MKLTYANVMSTVAVIVACAGGSSAVALSVGKGRVTSKDIKNGTIHAIDLHKGAVGTKELARHAVSAPKLAQASVGAEQIADQAVTGRTLGPVRVVTSSSAGFADASCAAGEGLLGGGASGGGGSLTTSSPTVSSFGSGWFATSTSGSPTASAICLIE